MRAASDGNQSPQVASEAGQTPGSVRTTLTYMAAGGQKPYVHTEALTGEDGPRYFAEMQDHEVAIQDGRPVAGDLYDDVAVERDYYPEVEALLMSVTGASRVVIFDHTRRTDAGERGRARAPASRVHNDYTERSGPARVRDVLGVEQIEPLRDVPVAQINLWRPIRGPVRRSPLALLDATSLDPRDLLATDLVYPDRVGEIYHLAYSPHHRLYYFPDMNRDEAVLIKGYDSRTDGRARFTPHTAFTDPTSPPDAPPRESIEVRALAFFE